MLKQLSIFISNEAGRLAEITGVLRDKGIDIKAPVSYTHLDVYKRQVLNIDYDLAMFLIAAVAAVYLVLGGYLASLAADFVQGLLIIGGVVFMIVFVMNSPTVGGFTHGISTVLDKMDAAGILRLDGNGIIGLISLILLTSIGTWGMPQTVSYTHLDVYKRQVKTSTLAPLALVSLMLLMVFSARFCCVTSATTGTSSVISDMVPCFSSPAAYASLWM